MNPEGSGMETRPPPEPPPRWIDGRLVDAAVPDGMRVAAVAMHLWWLAFPLLGPFAMLVTPVIWAPLQSRSGFIDDHGREAMNAQLTMLVLLLVPVCGWIVLLPWLPVWLFGSIRAAVAAGGGGYDRHPAIFRALR
jgi:uncharacterized Tic20 family protein